MTGKHTALKWLFIIIAVLAAGCNSDRVLKPAEGTVFATGQLTKEDLREQLDLFNASFKSTLNAAADEIEKTGSKKDQMLSLQMRARMLQGLYTMSQEDDPMVAFIDTWALCTRFRLYLEDGDGANLFGDNQSVAKGAARRIEARIKDVGRLFLSGTDFQTTEKDIIEFAQTNPIRANFSNLVAYASPATGDQTSPFAKIIGIPMAPLRGVEGVERTAEAVGRFTDTADRFSDVVADLPESVRWQLLLFLYELEEAEMSKSLVSSTAKLADATEQLPENIREQLSLFVDEIDRKQANLQATLAQADKTAESIVAALEKVKAGANSIDTAAKSVQQTADAWKQAADATSQAAKEIVKLKPQQTESSFNAKDIQQIAGNVTEASGQLQQTAADLNRLSGVLAWRIIEVIAAVLIAAIMYKIVVIRLSKSKTKD